MKISYTWLQSFFQKKLLSPDKLADLLTFHSFEVEEVKKQGKDWVLDIDVLPNRAHDCLCHNGVAKEISALLKYPFKSVDYGRKIKEISQKTNELVKVEVQDSELCPRYTARVIIDVKVESSSKQIKEKLEACGLNSINNVVDIANYVMLETGQPLHVFDADKISSKEKKKIIIRKAKKGEKIVCLDNEKYDLDESILLIADEKDPLCIAGVKGGIKAEVNNKTKRIILEAANFNPQVIRNGSRKIGLRTDASWRFENGIDPNLTEQAINMCAFMIQDMAKGKVLKGIEDFYPKKKNPIKINLDIEKVKSLLGIDISEKEAINILQRLGFESKKSSKLEISVPASRLDILIQEDLIEEIGRVYSFEKIKSELPEASLIPAIRSEDLVYRNKVKDIFINLGFSEAYNYSLLGDKEIDFYQRKLPLIELSNPASQEQKYLRPCLIPILIKNVRDNRRYFERVRLFEIGKVFNLNKKEVLEEKKLAGIISLEEKNLESNEFYRIKGIIDSLLNKLRITDQWYDDSIEKQDKAVINLFNPGKRAEIKVGNDSLGYLGEINQSILDNLGIKSKAAGFELDFNKLIELATEERIYSAPSKYPAMVRDIALFVDKGTKIVEVLNLINSSGGPLIKDIDLFDIYEGDKADNRKSLAFHIIFQSNERNLTDKEVNKLQDKIINALEQEGGWETRKKNAKEN